MILHRYWENSKAQSFNTTAITNEKNSPTLDDEFLKYAYITHGQMSDFLKSSLFEQSCLLRTEKWWRYEVNKVDGNWKRHLSCRHYDRSRASYVHVKGLATTEGNGVGCRARGGRGGEEEVAVWRGHRVESTVLPSIDQNIMDLSSHPNSLIRMQACRSHHPRRPWTT